jgi:TonB family protein
VFHAFISTRRPPSLRVPGIVASVAFHAALLSMAFDSHAAHVTSVPRAMGERVDQVQVAYAPPEVVPTRGPAPVARVTTPPRPRTAVLSVPQLPDLPREISLPLVDTEKMLDAPLLFIAGGDDLDAPPSIAHANRIGSSDGSFASRTIDGSMDTSAVQFPENPKPRYPADMLRQSIEASFIVYFVVDSTGLVDTESIEVPPSVKRPFELAVRLALSQWHYFPAQKRGRPVRQFVGQEFIFRVVQPRPWDGTSTA